MNVEAAMRHGATQYVDVISALAHAGYPASFTQTGGMCAAIEIRLERGNLLVTDASEELPWNPAALMGWGVGFYIDNDVCEGPLAYAERDSTDFGALLSAIEEALRDASRQLRGR